MTKNIFYLYMFYYFDIPIIRPKPVNIYGVYWLRPNYWNVEIVKHIKMKDVFPRGSSLKVNTTAAVSKKCFTHIRLIKNKVNGFSNAMH